jgi:type IV secretory pathway component VirB8
MVANIATISSDFVERPSLSEELSRNPMGLVVNIAVSSRRKSS